MMVLFCQDVLAAVWQIYVIATCANSDAGDEDVVGQCVGLGAALELVADLGVLEDAVGHGRRRDITDVDVVDVAGAIAVGAAVVVEQTMVDGDALGSGIGQQTVLVADEGVVLQRQVAGIDANTCTIVALIVGDAAIGEVEADDGEVRLLLSECL